jgi:hypothetical protein
LHYSLFSLTAVALALVAPVASADTTAFGTRTGDATPAAAATPSTSAKSPLLAELANLNKWRDGQIRKKVSARASSDKATLAAIRKKAGQDFDFLEKTSNAEQEIERGGTWNAIIPSKHQRLSSYAAEYWKLKFSRDRAIEAIEDGVFSIAIPYYSKLLEKSANSQQYDVAKKVKQELFVMDKNSKRLVFGKWRQEYASGWSFNFKVDYTLESLNKGTVASISGFSIKRSGGKISVISSDNGDEFFVISASKMEGKRGRISK